MFRPQIELSNNPVRCTVECQALELYLELTEFQCDPFLNITKAAGADLWKLLPNDRFPHMAMVMMIPSLENVS